MSLSIYIWLSVHATVKLRMLLIGLVGGKSLILNCIFSMGLNKNTTLELIACTICVEVLPVFRECWQVV